jgi:hypothetical protein
MGMDINEHCRSLDYVAVLKPEAIQRSSSGSGSNAWGQQQQQIMLEAVLGV